MNLRQYTGGGHDRYAYLATLVADLLARAITAEREYRLQQIQHRAKAVESVSARLEEIGQLETDSIEAYRKDLAGCRIVFYTNSDVTRFANSGILGELFDVDWDRSKFHQPDPGQQSAVHLFQSNNYVLKLQADRTSLLEFRELEGLYCEVQVQTSLNHVWAEMAHDTIYKRSAFQGFGSWELEVVEKRLAEVMREHLVPAGYLFQRIATDVQRLTQGKSLFDAGLLDVIVTVANNNERYEALCRIKEEILPHYNDLTEMFSEVRGKLRKAWLLAEETDTVPVETPFGAYEGHKSYEVTGQIAEIVKQYRYIEPEENYAFVRELYVQTRQPESRRQLVELAESLASHTFQIWQRYGPVIQVRLADELSKEENIDTIAPIATAMGRKILEPDITGATASSKAVTFHRGVVAYSQELQRARRTVIDTLALYANGIADSDDALRSVVNSLFSSGRMPPMGLESADVAAMILSDFAYAVERMIEFAPKSNFNMQQDIEARLLHCWRRKGSVPEKLRSEGRVVEARDRLTGTMRRLRDILNADEEFVIFKTIVGYKSVFPHQWEEEEADFNRDQEVRHQRQDDLADSIVPENWSTWKARLATAANAKSSDGATWAPLVRFLSALVERQPRLGVELLTDRHNLPDWTIRPIAAALLKGELRVEVEALLGQWLDEGRYVEDIAELSVSTAHIDGTLVSKVAVQAKKKTNTAACTKLVVGAIRRYIEVPQFWRDEIFFPCLVVLKERNNYDWITCSWHKPGEGSIFASLTTEHRRILLEAMVGVNEIDYQAEQILTTIASSNHQMVLDWFGRRIEMAAQETSLNFDPVSYSLESVHEILQPHPRDVLASMRQWRDAGSVKGSWHVSCFLSRIYPNFEEPLPGALLKYISDADAEDLAFVASSLQGFEGRVDLLPILRAMLSANVATDDVEDCISHVLWETSVMVGEFGRARAHQAKAELLRPWLVDANVRVSQFAAREIRSHERVVASENRRAQEEVAMRRLQYGEPLESDDAKDEDELT